MAEKQNENMENNKPEVWKIIGMFAMVFLAVQLVISAFSLGVNYLMRQVGAGENAQIFVGSTISRIGMIAAGILITAPVIRVALKKKPGEILFPLKKKLGRKSIQRCSGGFRWNPICFYTLFTFRMDPHQRIGTLRRTCWRLAADNLASDFGKRHRRCY